MITIIHGSHRHGYSWNIVCALKAELNRYNVEITTIDLSSANINFCCGTQVCQESECLYKQDDFSKHIKNQLINAKGIFIITPTYFNMPPAKLKNFIDRTNALLPLFENMKSHPFFGACVYGEADDESIACNLNLLIEYADIMGWNNIKTLNITKCLTDTAEIDYEKIKNIANLIYRELRSEDK